MATAFRTNYLQPFSTFNLPTKTGTRLEGVESIVPNRATPTFSTVGELARITFSSGNSLSTPTSIMDLRFNNNTTVYGFGFKLWRSQQISAANISSYYNNKIYDANVGKDATSSGKSLSFGFITDNAKIKTNQEINDIELLNKELNQQFRQFSSLTTSRVRYQTVGDKRIAVGVEVKIPMEFYGGAQIINKSLYFTIDGDRNIIEQSTNKIIPPGSIGFTLTPSLQNAIDLRPHPPLTSPSSIITSVINEISTTSKARSYYNVVDRTYNYLSSDQRKLLLDRALGRLMASSLQVSTLPSNLTLTDILQGAIKGKHVTQAELSRLIEKLTHTIAEKASQNYGIFGTDPAMNNQQYNKIRAEDNYNKTLMEMFRPLMHGGVNSINLNSKMQEVLSILATNLDATTPVNSLGNSIRTPMLRALKLSALQESTQTAIALKILNKESVNKAKEIALSPFLMPHEQGYSQGQLYARMTYAKLLGKGLVTEHKDSKPERIFFKDMVGSAFELIGAQEPGITLRGAEHSHFQQNMPFGKTTRLLTSTASADSTNPYEVTRAGESGVESKMIVYDNERLYRSMSQLYSTTLAKASEEAGKTYEQIYRDTMKAVFGDSPIKDEDTIYMLPFKKPEQTVQRLKNLLGAKSAIQFDRHLIDKIKNQESISGEFDRGDGFTTLMVGEIPIALPPAQYEVIVTTLKDLISKYKANKPDGYSFTSIDQQAIKKELVKSLKKREMGLQPLKGFISGDETRAVLINLGINDLSDPFQVNKDYLDTKAFGHRMITKIKFQAGSSKMTTTSGNLFFNNPYLQAQIDVVNSFTPGKTVVYTSTTLVSSNSNIHNELNNQYEKYLEDNSQASAIAKLKNKYRFLKDVDVNTDGTIKFKIVAGMYNLGNDFKFYGEYDNGQVQLLYSPQTIGKIDTTTSAKDPDKLKKHLINYNFNTFNINIAGATYKTTNGIFVLTDSLQLNAEEGANMTGVIQWGLTYDPIGRPGYSLIKGPFNAREGILFEKYLDTNKNTNPFAKEKGSQYFGYTGVGAIKGYNYEAGLALLDSSNATKFERLLNIRIGNANNGVKLSNFLIGITIAGKNDAVRKSLKELVDTTEKVDSLISAFKVAMELNGNNSVNQAQLAISVKRLVSMIKDDSIESLGLKRDKLDTLVLKHPSLLAHVEGLHAAKPQKGQSVPDKKFTAGDVFAESISYSLGLDTNDFGINSLFTKAIQSRHSQGIDLNAFNEHDPNVRAAGLLADIIYSNLQITTFQSISGVDRSISEIGFHKGQGTPDDKIERFNRIVKHTEAVRFILQLSGLKLSKKAREVFTDKKYDRADLDIKEEIDEVLDIVFYRFSNSPIIQKYLPVMPSSSLVPQGKESAVGLEFQYSLAMSSSTLNYLRGTGLDFEGETAFAAAYNTIINFLQDPLRARQAPTALKFHSAFSLIKTKNEVNSPTNSFIDYLKLSSALGAHGNKLVRELKIGNANRSLAEEAILDFIRTGGKGSIDSMITYIQDFSTELSTSIFKTETETPVTFGDLDIDLAVNQTLSYLQENYERTVFSHLQDYSTYEVFIKQYNRQINATADINNLDESFKKPYTLFKLKGLLDENTGEIIDIEKGIEVLEKHDLKIKQLVKGAISESNYTRFISSLHQEAAIAKSMLAATASSLLNDSQKETAKSLFDNVYQTRAIALPNIMISVEPIYGKRGVAEIVSAQEGYQFQSFSIKLLGLDILQAIPLEFGNYTDEIVNTQQRLRELLPDYFRIINGIIEGKGRLIINHMDKEIISTVEELAVKSNFDLEKIATGIMGQHAIGEVNKYPGVSTSNTISSLLLDVNEAIAGRRIFGEESPYLKTPREARDMQKISFNRSTEYYKIHKELQKLNFKKYIPRNISELRNTIDVLSRAILGGVKLDEFQEQFLITYIHGTTEIPKAQQLITNGLVYTKELARLDKMTKELNPEKAEKLSILIIKIKEGLKEHQNINQYNYTTINTINLNRDEVKLLLDNVSDYSALQLAYETSNENIQKLKQLYTQVDEQKEQQKVKYQKQISIKRDINQLRINIDDEKRRLSITQQQAYEDNLQSERVINLTTEISKKYEELDSTYKETSNVWKSKNYLFNRIKILNNEINELYSGKQPISKLLSLTQIKEVAAQHFAIEIATEVKKYFRDHLKNFNNINAQILTNIPTNLPSPHDSSLYKVIRTQIENDNIFGSNSMDDAIKNALINSVYNATIALREDHIVVETFTNNQKLKEIKGKYKEFKSLLFATGDKSKLDITSLKGTTYETLFNKYIETEKTIDLFQTSKQEVEIRFNEITKQIKDLEESNVLTRDNINKSIESLKTQLTDAKIVAALPRDELNNMWIRLSTLESEYTDAKKKLELTDIFSKIKETKAKLSEVNKLDSTKIFSNINLIMKYDVYSILKSLDGETPVHSTINTDIQQQIDYLDNLLKESELKIDNFKGTSEIELLTRQNTQDQIDSIKEDINLLTNKSKIITTKIANLLTTTNQKLNEQNAILRDKQELVSFYLEAQAKLDKMIKEQSKLLNIHSKVQAQELLKEIKAIKSINNEKGSYYIKDGNNYKPLSHIIEAGQTSIDVPLYLVTSSVDNYTNLSQSTREKEENLKKIRSTIGYIENKERLSFTEDLEYYRSQSRIRSIFKSDPDLKKEYNNLIASLEGDSNKLKLYSELRNVLNVNSYDPIYEQAKYLIGRNDILKVNAPIKQYIDEIYDLITNNLNFNDIATKKQIETEYGALKELQVGDAITVDQLKRVESLLDLHYQKEAYKIEALKRRRLSIESNSFHRTINELVRTLTANFIEENTMETLSLSSMKNMSTVLYTTQEVGKPKKVHTHSLINMVLDPLTISSVLRATQRPRDLSITDTDIDLSLFISNIESTLNSGSMHTTLGTAYTELNKRIKAAKELQQGGSEAFVKLINNLLIKDSKTKRVTIDQATLRTIFRLSKSTYSSSSKKYKDEYDKYLGHIQDDTTAGLLTSSIRGISSQFQEVIKLSTKDKLYKEMRDKGLGNALNIRIAQEEYISLASNLNNYNNEIKTRINNLIERSRITSTTNKIQLQNEIDYLISQLTIDTNTVDGLSPTAIRGIDTPDEYDGTPLSLVTSQADLILELQKKSRESVKAVSELHVQLNRSIIDQQEQISLNKSNKEIRDIIEAFDLLTQTSKDFINAESNEKKLKRTIESIRASRSYDLSKVELYKNIIDTIYTNVSTDTTNREVLKSAIKRLRTDEYKDDIGISKVLEYIDNPLSDKLDSKTLSKILTKKLTYAESLYLQVTQTTADITRRRDSINRLEEQLAEQKGERINQDKLKDYIELNKVVATATELANGMFNTFTEGIKTQINTILSSDESISTKYKNIAEISNMELSYNEQKLLKISIEEQKIEALNTKKLRLVNIQTKVQDYLYLTSLVGTPIYKEHEGERYISSLSAMHSDIKVLAVSKIDDTYTAHASIIYNDNIIDVLKEKGLANLTDATSKEDFKKVISEYQVIKNDIKRLIKSVVNQLDKKNSPINASKLLNAIASPLVPNKLNKDDEALLAVEQLEEGTEKALYNRYSYLVIQAELLMGKISNPLGVGTMSMIRADSTLGTLISRDSKLSLNDKIEQVTDSKGRETIIDNAIDFRLNEVHRIQNEIIEINKKLKTIGKTPKFTIDETDTILTEMVKENSSIVGMILRAAAPTGGSHVQHSYQINTIDTIRDKSDEQKSLLKISDTYSDALAILPTTGAFGTQGGDFDGDSYQILIKYHETYQKYLETKQEIKDLESALKHTSSTEFIDTLNTQLNEAKIRLESRREEVDADLAESKRIQDNWVKGTDQQVRRHVASFTGMPMEMLQDKDLFTQEQVSTMIQQQRGIHKDMGDLSSNKTRELFIHFKTILSRLANKTIRNDTLKTALVKTLEGETNNLTEKEKENNISSKLLAKINANFFTEAFTKIEEKDLYEEVIKELATIETVQVAFKNQASTIDAVAGTIFDDRTYEGLQSFIGEVGTTLIGKGYNALIPLMTRGANIRVFSDMLGSEANLGIPSPYEKAPDNTLTSLDDVLGKIFSSTPSSSSTTTITTPTPSSSTSTVVSRKYITPLSRKTAEKAQKITGALGLLQQIIRDSIKLKPSTTGKSDLIHLLLKPENANLTDPTIADDQQALNYRDFISTADIAGTDLDSTAQLNAFGAILLLSDYTDARGMATRYTENGAYVFDNDIFNKQLGYSKQTIDSSKRFSVYREKEDYYLALNEGTLEEFNKKQERELIDKHTKDLIEAKIYAQNKNALQARAIELAQADMRIKQQYYDIEDLMLQQQYGITAKQFARGYGQEEVDSQVVQPFSFKEELVANTIAEMLNRATSIEAVDKYIGLKEQPNQTRAQLKYLKGIFIADKLGDTEKTIADPKGLYEQYQEAYGDEYIEASRIALGITGDDAKDTYSSKIDTMSMEQMQQELIMFSFVQKQFQGISGQDIKYLGNVGTSKRRILKMDYAVQSAYSPFVQSQGEAFTAYQLLIRRGQLIDSPENLANINQKVTLDMARALYETGSRINALNGNKEISTKDLQQAMSFAADSIEMMGLKPKDLLGDSLTNYITSGNNEDMISLNQAKKDKTDTFLNYLLGKDIDDSSGNRLQKMAVRQAGIYQVAEYTRAITALDQEIKRIDIEEQGDVTLKDKREEYERRKKTYEDEISDYQKAYKELTDSKEMAIKGGTITSEAETKKQNALTMIMRAIDTMGTKLLENDTTHNYLQDDTSYLNTQRYRDQQKIIRATKVNQTMNLLAAPLLSGILASGMAFSDYGMMTGYDVLQGYAGYKADQSLGKMLSGEAGASVDYERFSKMSAGFTKQRIRDQLSMDGTTGLVSGIGFELASRGIASLAATGIHNMMGGYEGGGVGGVLTEVLSDVAASSVYTMSQVVARDKSGASRMLGRSMESYTQTSRLMENLSNMQDAASYLTSGLLELLQEGDSDYTIDSEVTFDVESDYNQMAMLIEFGDIDLAVLNDQANPESGTIQGEVQNPMEMYTTG